MDFTDKDKAVLADIIEFFYKQGGVRSRQMVADLDGVIQKLFAKKPAEVSDAPAAAAEAK